MFFPSVDFVACGVALAFLHVDAPAVRHEFADMAGDVLGGGIERKLVVEARMVEVVDHDALDFREIRHHAVVVQLPGTAMHGHNPVVAVEVAAFALVVEFEAVGRRYFETFGYVIHV